MSSNASILNEEIIDDLRAILGDGYRDIFNDQILQATNYIQEISAMMGKGELEKLPKKAHALKSSAGQVGLQSIHLLAKDLEFTFNSDAAQGELSQRARDLFAQIVREYETAVRCLYAYLGEKAGTAPLVMAINQP